MAFDGPIETVGGKIRTVRDDPKIRTVAKFVETPRRGVSTMVAKTDGFAQP